MILSSDKSSERNLSSFFDTKKSRRIKHLQSEEPFSSDPYFSYTSKVSRTLLKKPQILICTAYYYTYIVLEQKKTCLVFIGPQVATFIYQRDRILLPNHQLGGWFCPRVVISLGKSYLQILIAVRSIRFIWYPLGGLRLEKTNNKKVSSWISHLNFKEISPEGRMGGLILSGYKIKC